MKENKNQDEKKLIDLAKQGGELGKEALGKLYELYHGYVEAEEKNKNLVKILEPVRSVTIYWLLSRQYLSGLLRPNPLISW